MNTVLLPKGHSMLSDYHVDTECPTKIRDDVVKRLLQIYNSPPWGNCVGMAAPQIGYPYNIFVAMGKVFENVVSVVPIEDADSYSYEATEGCYSIPHESHKIRRFSKVNVSYNDGSDEVYEGFMAQVIQHEFDHIKGKLINSKD